MLNAIITGAALVIPAVAVVSCAHAKPYISLSEDDEYTTVIDNVRVAKGSAKDFYDLNTTRLFNPISGEDKFYKLYLPDGSRLNNRHDTNHKFQLKESFKFLKLDNLTGAYSYRVFSFKYDDLVENIPGVATKSKYTKHKNNTKAVYIVLYWVDKTKEAAPNWKEKILEPSKTFFPEVAGPERLEEAPWAFKKGIIETNRRGFWEFVTEPLVVLFEEE
ncbi:hypothetical protein [Mycoplasma enhydrae]|uniref:hypothetical protein n=1 Tax=Mycoplasma enhydrae TaxID=2499220 RepID=UPI00197C822C|nr:hypothetical protein [Mycoplasma enhydrae]